MNRKTITVAFVILLIFTGVVIYSQITSRSSEPLVEINSEETTKEYPTETDIENLSSISSELDEDTVEVVKSRLLTWVQTNNPNKQYTKLTGLVRQGSLKKEIIDDTNKLTFIFDEEDLKQSYRVEVSRSSNDSSNFVYIFCVSESEQIYPDFECKDFNTL